MKTRLQKQEELKQGEELLKKSKALIFVDFSKVKTSDLRNLRRELKASGNPLLVIKKRLLNLVLKGKELPFKEEQFKTSMATVFASNLEAAASAVYKFFKSLETEKKIEGQKILGGYDAKKGDLIEAKQVIFIGSLPPREILLTQLAAMIAAPIRSFLYVLSERSKQMVENK